MMSFGHLFETFGDMFDMFSDAVSEMSFLMIFGGYLLTDLRIFMISPNSSIFGSGYLRAQEELEARTRWKIKLKVNTF